MPRYVAKVLRTANFTKVLAEIVKRGGKICARVERFRAIGFEAEISVVPAIRATPGIENVVEERPSHLIDD